MRVVVCCGSLVVQLRDCSAVLYDCYRLDLWHSSLAESLLAQVRTAPRAGEPFSAADASAASSLLCWALGGPPQPLEGLCCERFRGPAFKGSGFRAEVWGTCSCAALVEGLGLQGATNLLLALSYFQADEGPLFDGLLSQARAAKCCRLSAALSRKSYYAL